jgi:hypothetical protein
MTERHRWVCPNCGDGVLLGARPRRNATARFCLPCSKQASVLVERGCPVLKRKRAQKRDVRETKRKRQQAKARELETVSGLHVPTELRKICRTLTRRRVFPRGLGGGEDIELDLRIRRVKKPRPARVGKEMWARYVEGIETYRSGRANGFRVVLELGCRCPRHLVLALLLHELCHVAAPAGERHGDHFATLLAEGAKELWGIDLETIHRASYDLDSELERKLEAHLEDRFPRKTGP